MLMTPSSYADMLAIATAFGLSTAKVFYYVAGWGFQVWVFLSDDCVLERTEQEKPESFDTDFPGAVELSGTLSVA